MMKPSHEIIGIVGELGAGGVQSAGETDWRLVFFFDGWRRKDGPVEPSQLRVEMHVSHERLTSLKKQIGAYDILSVRGRMAKTPAGRKQLNADEIISFDGADSELEIRRETLQKPVVVQDPQFGSLTLNRGLHWYTGKTLWAGGKITLNLSMDEGESIEGSLAAAKEMWREAEDWNTKILRCAVEHLLPVKNGTWLEEGEPKMKRDQFVEKISLDSVTISTDEAFEFLYQDGGLFDGHAIVVRGSLKDGPETADIYG